MALPGQPISAGEQTRPRPVPPPPERGEGAAQSDLWEARGKARRAGRGEARCTRLRARGYEGAYSPMAVRVAETMTTGSAFALMSPHVQQLPSELPDSRRRRLEKAESTRPAADARGGACTGHAHFIISPRPLPHCACAGSPARPKEVNRRNGWNLLRPLLAFFSAPVLALFSDLFGLTERMFHL